MANTDVRKATRPYGGYDATRSSRVDTELTDPAKDRPCGEYLRRFWQPICLAENLKDVAVRTRLMGEDLVVFRDLSGDIGVLHAACSHRGTSLEFGLIVEHGIRCAYHGWHYAVDGSILEVPSEKRPGATARFMSHGAYPAHEYEGIVFVYMGPPEEKPEFPVYDFMRADGELRVPYQWEVPCNWVQVRENCQDPIHLTFLHSMFSIKQFGDVTLDIPTINAYETAIGQITTSVRRMDDLYYCRVNELILPNIGKTADLLITGAAIPANNAGDPSAFNEAGQLRYRRQLPSTHGLGLSMWVVPADETNSTFFGWHHLPTSETPEQHAQRIRQITHGQMGDRTYEQRQRDPGDFDAIVSQGRSVSRDNDNLTPADVGIAMYRRQLRAGIQAVARGEAPKGPLKDYVSSESIPTYAYALTRPAPPGLSDADELRLKKEFERDAAQSILAHAVPHTPRVLEPFDAAKSAA